MKKVFTLLFSLHFFACLQAQQANDCATRILICGDANLNNNSFGAGNQEFPGGVGCLLGGEHQSAWYEVIISASGTLEFTLTPNAGTGEDYDFAIWGPNPSCNGLGTPLRCSFADANCSLCPQTGLGMGATDVSEPAPGQDGFVAPINAIAGQHYYILIDNFNSSSQGFTLDWTGTAELGRVDVKMGMDMDVCAPATVPLLATLIGGTSSQIAWQADPSSALAFLNNPNILNPVATIPPGYVGAITYSLGVNQGDCMGYDEIVINVADPEITAYTVSSICNSATGSINTTVTGAPPPLMYHWSNNAITPNINQLTPGEYTVTVTSATGCSAEEVFEVTPNNIPPILIGNPTPAICNSATGAIDLTAAVGLQPFQYEWSNTATTQDLMNIPPGTYTVLVTDAKGCTNEGSYIVTSQAVPLTVSATIQNAFCNLPNGSLQATPTTGLAPYTYLWSNAATTATISNLGVGTYSVTVKDSRGCIGVNSFSITTSPLPSIVNPGPQNHCSQYILPPVQSTNGALNTVQYFTGVNGSGTAYNPGDTLTVSGKIYIFSNLGANCSLQDSFLLTIRQASSSSVNATRCPGGQLVVNGHVYNAATPSGTEVLTAANAVGCDSLIFVQLQFYPPSGSSLSPTLCPGQSLSVGNQTFNQANASGTVVLSQASAHGCDSTIQVNVSYYPPATKSIAKTFCAGQSFQVGNQVFNESNPSGTVTLAGAAQHGCDSLVSVVLTYTQSLNTFLTPQLCPGGTFTVSGTTFGPSNPSGQVTLMSSAACDSIVHVNLQYYPPPTGVYQPAICEGTSITYQNQVFNQAHPSGTITLPAASFHGCDSTVNVSLTFLPKKTSQLSPTVCGDESLSLGSSVFNAANPSGNVLFTSFQGCDSTVEVNLKFYPPALGTLDRALCNGQSLAVGNQVFNQANPSGSVVLPNAAFHGCDSTVQVNLTFVQTLNTFLAPTLCPGGSVNVSGNIFNAANPTGNVMLTSLNGCDSIVHVDLSFYPPATGAVSPTRCANQNFVLGNQTFTAANPSGNVILQAASHHGCDSTVAVNVNFIQPVHSYLTPKACPGGSFTVSGTTFNQSNPAGIVTLQSALTSCDSLVHVNLGFYAPVPGNYASTLCEDETLSIGNTTFSKSHPSGTVLFPAAGAHGCDSSLLVNLTFIPIAHKSLTPVLCDGEVLSVGATTFNAANPSGTVTLTSAAGCDSIVTVQLTYVHQQNTFLTPILCPGASITIAGQTFNSSHTTETIALQSAAGCDSMVHVNVGFYPPAKKSIVRELCMGESLSVGNQTFNAAHPSGTVTLTAAAQHGCDSTVTVSLSFVPVIHNNILPLLCPGETFQAAGMSFSAQHPMADITLQSSGGCDSIVHVALSFYPEAIGTLDVEKCPGEKFIYQNITLSESKPNAAVLLQNASAHGCDSLLDISVHYHYLTLDLGPDLSVSLGDSVQLLPISNAQIAQLSWIPVTFLSNPTLLTPFAKPEQNMVYTLRLVDEAGCKIEDRINIKVDHPNIYAPNIISPNGDGDNDYFTLFAGKNINNIRLLRVYDRWGEQMFERRNFAPNVDALGWDGTYKGKKMTPAVFVWYAEVDLPGGKTVLLKGDVTVLE